MYNNKKVAFFTLGCKLNFSETSSISRKFESEGFERVDFKETADVYVINSCSVTEHSDKKSRSMIRQAIRRNPKAIVAVMGCYAQLKSDEISHIEGIDYIFGTQEKYNIMNYLGDLTKNKQTQIITTEYKKIETFNAAFSKGDRTRCFLKVQDGCNYFCTYCTIPMARGRSRNDTIANTVLEAEKVAASGIKEIILTGVNIGDFGQTTNEKFIDLVKALDNVEGIERFRISSIEPNLLTNEVIEFVAQSKRFAPHFHIPLQAGSDGVLELMKRRYKREVFASRIDLIKSLMPDAFIGVDIIAGMSGETDELFEDGYNFVKNTNLTQLHVFPYSERPNTKALEIEGKVPVPERKRRAHLLQEISERKLHLFYDENIGTTRTVLFEEQAEKGKMVGFTENYIRTETDYNPNYINRPVQVELVRILENGNMDVRILSE